MKSQFGCYRTSEHIYCLSGEKEVASVALKTGNCNLLYHIFVVRILVRGKNT
jgi:hypothetical protein